MRPFMFMFLFGLFQLFAIGLGKGVFMKNTFIYCQPNFLLVHKSQTQFESTDNLSVNPIEQSTHSPFAFN